MKRYKGKVDIPAIFIALRDAEHFIESGDPDKKRIGVSMKSFFERLLTKRRQELKEAIEKSAKAKRTHQYDSGQEKI